MPESQDSQDRRSLAGKTALVTGASRGIGRAVATRLAARGALVAVHYGHGRREADEVVAAIVAGGHAAFAVGADLSRSSAAEDLFETLDAEFVARTGGRDLDVLVNNAGIGPRAPIEEVSTRVLDAVVQINLKAPFLLIQQASPRLRRGGRIINVSSMATQHAFPELAAYVAAKGGLEVLTLALAQHFGPRGITVNAVLPGATATDMSPASTDPAIAKRVAASTALGRLGEPDDVADVIAFLASDEARWITAQRIEVSGGQRI
jgi:NAD(P)-dependent dehydrogenase (short-subunit alcohol dehydrogenase family)